jgi:hypothetical protein
MGYGLSECYPISSSIGANNKYVFSFMRADKITNFPVDFTKDLFLAAQKAADSKKTFDIQ